MKRNHRMRRASIAIALVMILTLALSSSISAQPTSLGTGFWSVQTLQNIGGATANVTATAYQLEAGQTESVPLFTIARGAGKNILPSQIAGPTDPKIALITSGSMVIGSDQRLAAIVGITNQFIGSLGVQGGTSAGVYEGTAGENVSSQLLFPILKKNYFGQNTLYYVQNASNTTAANVQVTFNWGASSSSTQNFTIQPNRSIVITPPSAMPGGNDADGLGSATVRSTNGPGLAGVHFELDTAVPSKLQKTARAFVQNDLANEMYLPSFKKAYFGNDTNISVQSPDGAVAGTIEYTCADSEAGGCTKGTKFSVQFSTTGAGKTYNAWPRNADHNALPTKSLYSAVVKLNAGQTAVANAGETGALFSKNEESMYVGQPKNADPLANRNFACPAHKELYFNNAGGTVIFPLTYPANVTIEFTVVDNEKKPGQPNPGAKFTATTTITAQDGSKVLYDVANGVSPSGLTWGAGGPAKAGALYSLAISANQPLAVISNETVSFRFPNIKLDGRQYNCFPTTAATQ